MTGENAPTGRDRRREVRVTSINLINYSAPEDPEDPEKRVFAQLGTARTVDISANGCCVRSSHPWPKDVELSFDLQLGDHIVSCTGRVARVVQIPEENEWDVGIEFNELDAVAADGIRMYLSFKSEGA